MKLQFFFALAILIKYTGAECQYSYEGLRTCDGCSGSCDVFNGCYCSDGLEKCLPNGNVSCNSFDPSMCCPSGLYYSIEESCCTTTPTCAPLCATDEKCNNATCQCNGTMYKNLKRNDFHPMLVCGDVAITVSASRCQLETLGYDPSTMRLRDPSSDCTYLTDSITDGIRNYTIQSQLKLNWCGTTVTSDETNIYFSNTINIGVQNKSVIIVNPMKFNFTCAYKRNMKTSLQLPGNITTQTVMLPGINGSGEFPLTMAAYKDQSYSNPFQVGEEVLVGTDIYVGLFVTGPDGNEFVLLVDTCIASPSDNRSDPNAFTLITGGCTTDTVSTTVVENGKSLSAEFRISSFKFQDQPYVYLFCDARLCLNSTGTCSNCGGLGRSSSPDSAQVSISLSIGTNNFMVNSGKHTAASWAVLAGIQLAYGFIKLF